MSEFTYKGNSFYLDGKPFTVIAGSIHYWRVVPEYWEDRLKKLKACGFNTVETYTAWNLHERREGQFDFSGGLDIVRFIELAESLDLKVIIRPGPYICAEFDFGGLPSWLLSYENLHIRCNDPKYLEKVRPYYRELFSRIAPHMCTRGGGIIMVQIENEYGSYGDDKDYLQKVVEIYKEHGIDCLLFTGDGIVPSMLSGGALPDYLCAVNFGSCPRDRFASLAAFRPNQPSFSSEFWSGWFEHWGDTHKPRKFEETINNVRTMLDMGASFSMYMFHGGTNFGFTNGANHTVVEHEYRPTITSYDYGAPLSEAGDMTPTFYAIRDEIAKWSGSYVELDVKDTEKKAYGKVPLTEGALLFENLDTIGTTVHSPAPLSMEQVGQDFGYILYSSTLLGALEEKQLELEHVHDRAWVYLDGKLAGIRQRSGQKDDIMISVPEGESLKLDILVENCGRINYGPKLFDKKGIYGGIRHGNRFHFGWDITSLTMDDLSGLRFTDDVTFRGTPIFLKGILNVQGTPADTFLRLDGFHKGFVTVNGFNLGRYWNDKGPMKTLYVPAPFLREGENEIIVFESEGLDKAEVEFFAEPDLG